MQNLTRIFRAVRFNLKKTNLVWTDVVELEGSDGNPEVWTRNLRKPGHEDPTTGSSIVWRRLRFVTFDEAVEGRRDFEERAGCLESEFVLQTCTTQEHGPSAKDREQENA